MNKQTFVSIVLVAILAGGGGYWLALSQSASTTATDGAPAGERKPLFYRNPMNPAITSPVPAQDEMGMDYIPVYAEKDEPKEKKVLFYRNPMNPAITSPAPAQDEMGMDYIPVYADGGADADEPTGTVRIDPVTVQNIGVRTARAERRDLSHAVRAVGRVDFNEERLARQHPKTEGWIEVLRVSTTGSVVKKDDILLSIYSPQLVSSQEEYLLALNNLQVLKDSPYEEIRRGAQDLVNSARQRLLLLDVPEHQIHELETTRKLKKRIHIHSPFDGTVMKVGVREGQYVTPKTELYMLADLSRVWVYVDVYEEDLPWVKQGDKADMRVRAVPGRTFRGTVTYIYPYMERKTRTARVRLEFDNPDLLLKPEMFANIILRSGRVVDAVVVPSEAVVRSGERDLLFVVRAPGKFEPRPVILGLASEGRVQIIEGVAPGEEVVTSAQFLIDSESKLREATAKMLDSLAGGNSGGAGADMSDMDMGDMDMSDMDDMDMSDMSMDDGQ
ncbi:Probable Co/Zn/Cd efflux system membrane fusion protein [hydrothermal vent metagenome]|uniref:Probable Co/Zn/Cd efflux system membrane fusion protein n=1 Tax=hydrothermal vent metagenome TaxID=652676 RepID=A0A3B1ALR9_9ZZZZ